jgi:uncharacterized membrane protein YozB (DUF420 family)
MSALFAASAPATADVIVVVELVIAVLLLLGAFLVRRGYVRAHAIIQGSMVLVNIPIVLIWMVPQYLSSVAPDLASEGAQPFYLVPTIMLVAGAAAEVLGVYILLVAGTNWVPDRFRFRRYKLWMRTELVLWWAVILLGMLTYAVWYAGVAGSS